MFSAALILLLASPFYINSVIAADSTGDDGKDESFYNFWAFRLCLNLLGYATIAVPGYLLIRWVKQNKYLETASKFYFFSDFLRSS